MGGKDLVEIIGRFPEGVSPAELEGEVPYSRATLNRRLREALAAGELLAEGTGPVTRYRSTDPLAAIRAYFERPANERKSVPYREELLEVTPALAQIPLAALAGVPRYEPDRRAFSRFLIDFSCASSALEGGTYSLLDTQVLIDYGERAPDKPVSDGALVLNHKNALEALYDHRSLDAIFKIHELLTDDHGLAALQDSEHFLPPPHRGVAREYNDVNIHQSAYLPPFRPGTGYVASSLSTILDRARALQHPIQASFYLLTRIPYLQPFVDGNKRLARVLCNVPLLNAKLPPISFVDFRKRDYLIGMLAFYELGDTLPIGRCFVDAYKRSIARLGLQMRAPTPVLPEALVPGGEQVLLDEREVANEWAIDPTEEQDLGR